MSDLAQLAEKWEELSREEKLAEMIAHPKILAGLYFKTDDLKPLELADYQEEIIRIILRRNPKRTLCWAATRAGKSLAIALGIILLANLMPGRRIRVIAPTEKHARIIMQYVTQHLLDHPTLTENLDTKMRKMPLERLKKEISKSRITFTNNSEIQIITADIATGGRALIGFGATDVFVDECEQLPQDLVKNNIMRMLGDTPDSCAFLISNPVKKGYMFDRMTDPNWHQITIGWEEAVKAGRLSQEFVEERRAEMTPFEFTAWYEAQYPEDIEDALFKRAWVIAAEKAQIQFKGETKIVMGVDVAEAGTDYTVATIVETDKERFNVLRIQDWHEADTMTTTGRIAMLADQFNIKEINVDDIGVGKGVRDRLYEMHKWAVNGVRVGESADKETARFLNKKAQYYWNLRTIFEEGRINIPTHSQLRRELSFMRWEPTSAMKIKIIDPEDKSPDFADSLMLACCAPGERLIFDFA